MAHAARTALLVSALALSAATVSAHDGRACSNASLAGRWGYTETGTVVTPAGAVLAAAVGLYTFDHAGTFIGDQHSSTPSGVSTDAKLGTYTVNDDCTGTLVLDVMNQAGAVVRHSVWSIVLTENGTGMQGIMLSMEMPGTGIPLKPVMTFTARRILTGDRGHGPRN